MSTDVEKEALEIERAISDYQEGSVSHVEFFMRAARLFYKNENNINEIKRQLSSPGIRSSGMFSWDLRDRTFRARRNSDFVTSARRAHAHSTNQYIEADGIGMDGGNDSVDGSCEQPNTSFDMPDGSFDVPDDCSDMSEDEVGYGYGKQSSSNEKAEDGDDIPDAGFVMPDGGYDMVDSINQMSSNSGEHDETIDDDDDDDPIPFLRGTSLKFFSEEEEDSEYHSDGLVCADGVGEDEVDAAFFRPKKSPSRKLLENSEQEVMKAFKQKMRAFDVPIGGGIDIHTVRVCCNPDICCNSSTPNIPLVMVHGIGGAIPAFYKNYEHLAIDRCVYGIDMPGFGLSARKVHFPNDPNACEQKMVDMINRWQKEMKIDKMILLGHSFGGYVSAAYTLKYYEHVHHLVMLDAWGIFSKEDDNFQRSEKLVEKIAMRVCQKLGKNPFAMFASLGDLIGRQVLRLFLDSKVQSLYGQTCIDYLIKMSLTGEQTGAKAFTVISNYTFCYPEQPLKGRLIKLLEKENLDLQVTFLYGEESLFCKCGRASALEVKKACPIVNVQYVKGAEHHVQVQKPEEMIRYILKSVYPASKGMSQNNDTSNQKSVNTIANQCKLSQTQC